MPDYGRWGGPLSYYCPATGEKKAYYRIVGDASCSSLAYLANERLIAVGTSIHGGSGTQPKVKQAVLFLWDHEKEEKVWEGTPDRPVDTFNALVAGPDGRLYGTIVGSGGPELFAFDPKQRKFVGSGRSAGHSAEPGAAERAGRPHLGRHVAVDLPGGALDARRRGGRQRQGEVHRGRPDRRDGPLRRQRPSAPGGEDLQHRDRQTRAATVAP